MIVESPFAPQTPKAATPCTGVRPWVCDWCNAEAQRKREAEINMRYLRGALRDCLLRQEAPFASHGLYTQPGVLDDTIAAEREYGIVAGFAWRSAAEMTLFYVDLGWSRGMDAALKHCTTNNMPWGIRHLPEGWNK